MSISVGNNPTGFGFGLAVKADWQSKFGSTQPRSEHPAKLIFEDYLYNFIKHSNPTITVLNLSPEFRPLSVAVICQVTYRHGCNGQRADHE